MLRTAIAAVLAGLLLAAVPASATTSDFGHTKSRDRVLRDGCHNYRYLYVVRAPTDDWLLETFLVDPRGEGVGAGAFVSLQNPARDHSRFRLCRSSTVPGTFKIRAKLTYRDGPDEFVTWFDPTRFRLRRAS